MAFIENPATACNTIWFSELPGRFFSRPVKKTNIIANAAEQMMSAIGVLAPGLIVDRRL